MASSAAAYAPLNRISSPDAGESLLYIKTFISWMRGGSYYKNWHGHLYGSDGGLLMDSIISNAMAHYLHFGLFLLGDTMDSARMPSAVKASLYRAKDITSFDTCSVRCEFEDGVSHSLYLTHSAPRDFYLNIEIGLEKGIAESRRITRNWTAICG